jgi:glutaredoxin
MHVCCGYAKADVKAYCREYVDLLGGQNDFDPVKAAEFADVVNSNAVAMFVQASCRYCESASSVLDEEMEHAEFTLSTIEIADSSAKGTLKAMLQNQNLTFPVVFIRGRYVGGCYELQKLIKQRHFSVLLSKKQPSFVLLPSLGTTRPMYLAQADGGPWLTFQLKGYSNVIRGYALLQVIVFAIIIILIQSDLVTASAAVMVFILADLLLFAITGPTPLSPMCGLATFFLWNRRGAPVTLIPYKIVFGVYIAGLIRQLLCDKTSGSCQHTGVFVSLLTNSAMLAVLRL